MKTIRLIIYFSLIFIESYSQTTFQKQYWKNNYATFGQALLKADHGNFFCLAYYKDSHPLDYIFNFITYFDSTGAPIWTNEFLGTNWQGNYIDGMSEMIDSSFYVFGYTKIFKFNSTGQPIWRKEYFNPSMDIRLTSVCKTINGGRYIFGNNMVSNQNYNLVLIKTDSSDEVEWARELFAGGVSYSGSIFHLSGDRNLITGTYNDTIGSDLKLFTIIMDSTGQIVSSRQYERSGLWSEFTPQLDEARSELYFTGYDGNASQNKNILCKINYNSGHVVWAININSEPLNKIILENDSIYLSSKSNGNIDILKFDTAGTFFNSLSWQDSYDFRFNMIKNGKNITLISNYNINSFIHLTQFNSEIGPFCSTTGPSIYTNPISFIEDTLIVSQNTITIYDTTINNHWSSLLFSGNKICGLTGLLNTESNNSFEIFPNPAIDQITIRNTGIIGDELTVDLYDIVGKSILTQKLNFHSVDQNVIQTGGIANGNYMLVIRDKSKIVHRTLIAIQ